MSKRLLIIFAYVIGSVLIFITTFHPEYRPLLFVGLGIVGVAFIITLIFVFGWKPDVEEEIK
ncbi:MAG: hypothetical protein ACYST9_06780, partial [Planctomycetota bacterium]